MLGSYSYLAKNLTPANMKSVFLNASPTSAMISGISKIPSLFGSQQSVSQNNQQVTPQNNQQYAPWQRVPKKQSIPSANQPTGATLGDQAKTFKPVNQNVSRQNGSTRQDQIDAFNARQAADAQNRIRQSRVDEFNQNQATNAQNMIHQSQVDDYNQKQVQDAWNKLYPSTQGGVVAPVAPTTTTVSDPKGQKFYMNGQAVDRQTYVNNQKSRLAEALKSGNQDLINRLWIDASKLGYVDDLNGTSQPTGQAPDGVEAGAGSNGTGTGTDAEIPEWQKLYNASEAQRQAQIKQINDLYTGQENSLENAFNNALGSNQVKNFLNTRNAYRKNALRGMDNSGVVGLMDLNLQNQYQADNERALNDYNTKLNALKQGNMDRVDTVNSRYMDKDLQSFKDKFLESQAKQDQAAVKAGQETAQQVLDMFKTVADKNQYDISPMLPYLFNYVTTGDSQGLKDFITKYTPQLSVKGENTVADTGAKVATADSKRSAVTGTVFMNGKQIMGANGKPLLSADYDIRNRKLLADAEKAKTDAEIKKANNRLKDKQIQNSFKLQQTRIDNDYQKMRMKAAQISDKQKSDQAKKSLDGSYKNLDLKYKNFSKAFETNPDGTYKIPDDKFVGYYLDNKPMTGAAFRQQATHDYLSAQTEYADVTDKFSRFNPNNDLEVVVK